MESNYLIYLAEAAVVTIILGTLGIPLLKKLKARQSVREEGPKSHRIKSGTPTMGGIFMLFASLIVVIFNKMIDPSVLWLLFLTLGHGILGFLDDFIKAEKKRNLGLTAKQKCLGSLFLPDFSAGGWLIHSSSHFPLLFLLYSRIFRSDGFIILSLCWLLWEPRMLLISRMVLMGLHPDAASSHFLPMPFIVI